MNQIGFCKWKCFTDLEVDFLQVVLVSDFMGLGSFYHLAAVFVGSAEPVNGGGVNGSDGLSPCVSGENCASMAIPAGKL